MIKNQKERCDLLAKYFEGIADTLQQIANSPRLLKSMYRRLGIV